MSKYPSIIRFIAGYKDKTKVVKVFLHGDNQEVKDSFQDCCKVSEGTCFEFVNVDQIKEVSEEDKETELCESSAPDVDDSTRIALGKIIQKYGDRISSTYSNVVAIQIGKVRRVRNLIQEQPCIILYCLDKSIIPFGENALPESIAGWPCDVREKLFILGVCPEMCTARNQNLPEPGCSIGIHSDDKSGSAGFLYLSKKGSIGSGFLTAAHVAVEFYRELYLNNTTLSNLPLETRDIVHPSCPDNDRYNNKIGRVVESYFGNYESEALLTGYDIAVVRDDFERPTGSNSKCV